jgi:hypothetical protein
VKVNGDLYLEAWRVLTEFAGVACSMFVRMCARRRHRRGGDNVGGGEEPETNILRVLLRKCANY